MVDAKRAKKKSPAFGKVRKKKEEQQQQKQRNKQGRVFDAAEGMQRSRRATLAVDEDLYKIPPELLCQKPKRRRGKILRNLLSGWMGLSCVR